MGQAASVALLGWLGWQTLGMRRSLTPPTQQTPLPAATKTLGEVMHHQSKRFRETWKQRRKTQSRDLNQTNPSNATVDLATEQVPDPLVNMTSQEASSPDEESDATMD
jgi:hypothetical protein